MLIIDRLTNAMATFVATPAAARKLADQADVAARKAGLVICDLKPLATQLDCGQHIIEVESAVRRLVANQAPASPAPWYCAQVAQALNWERTEFDTLDELLEELREHERSGRDFVESSACELGLLIEARNKLQAADGAGDVAWELAAQEVAQMLLVSCEPQPTPGTHAILHGTDYYPGSTILLQTAQLVAWRDADGQEHCERAHRVTLNPDRDGLAAAILSGIAGAQIAPEHIAELRAQMGGDIHG